MSSDSDGPSADSEPDPIEVFERANAEFQERVADIDPDDPGAASARMEAVDEFLKAIASVDPEPVLKRQTIAIVDDSVGFMTKSDAEKQLSNHVRGQQSERAERPAITELLETRVRSIEKLVADESGAEARYRFIFDDESSLIVDSETLYSPTKFRRAYSTLFDVLPRFEAHQEDWENLLHDLQQTRLESKPDAVGPRSAAIQKLRSKVSKSEAYLDAGEAVRNNGVLVEAATETEAEAAIEDGEPVWISSDEIKRICDENEITPEALRIEMDNRGLRAGTSKEKRFGGNRRYFWPLRGDEFEPKLIEPPAGGEDGETTDD